MHWNKYIALICNTEVNGSWGYFKGPEKSFIGVGLKQNTIWTSGQKPVLVLPANILDFEDKIVISNRAWMVQEYDAISTPGVVYYSLIPTTVSKEVAAENADKEVYIEKYNPEPFVSLPEIEGSISVKANQQLTVSTEGAYFKSSDKNIKVVKRTSNEVVFSIPFGITEVEIQTKEKGDIKTFKYRVV